MAFFDDEIKKDLEAGEVYTAKEISSIVYFKEGAIILCEDVSVFHNSDNETKFKVVERIETYLHSCVQRTYRIPNSKSIVYKIKKVY